MKASLYLSQYHKENIKNEVWYQLVFFDNINGLVFKTYIHEKNLILEYINLIDNGNPETLERLKKELANVI
mgnify:CR=1 FL=1